MREDDAAPLVDIGGRRLALQYAGAGAPTVVFEAGLGCDSTTWDTVFADTAAITRTCRYDRAGLGASDPAPTPRTARDMAHDLHALLARAAAPPYVLVGALVRRRGRPLVRATVHGGGSRARPTRHGPPG